MSEHFYFLLTNTTKGLLLVFRVTMSQPSLPPFVSFRVRNTSNYEHINTYGTKSFYYVLMIMF